MSYMGNITLHGVEKIKLIRSEKLDIPTTKNTHVYVFRIHMKDEQIIGLELYSDKCLNFEFQGDDYASPEEGATSI